MSTLIVEELVSTLTQNITTNSNSYIQLQAIRPHLMIYGSGGLPSGSLYMEVRSNADALIATSDTVAISTIASNNYYHGFYKFTIQCGLAPSTTYKIKLLSTGYTYNGGQFAAWCRAWDDDCNERGFTPTGSFDTPFGLQIWSYKNVIRGGGLV